MEKEKIHEEHHEEQNTSRVVSSLILGLSIVMAGFFINDGLKKSNKPHMVNVRGVAERVVKSNIGIWQISYSVSGNNLSQLTNNISTQTKLIKNFLLVKGFTESEIQEGAISVVDNKANNYSSNSHAPAYQINGIITLTTGKVDLLSSSSREVNELLTKGVLITYNNVVFNYTNLSNDKKDMLLTAYKNAENSAGVFCKSTKSALGRVQNGNQGLFTVSNLDNSQGDSTSLLKKVKVVVNVGYSIE